MPGQAAGPDKCIVVAVAHSDDTAQIAGATLARYVTKGYKGVCAVLASHPAGNASRPGQLGADALEVIQHEREKALATARRYGATTVFFDLHPIRIQYGRGAAGTGSPLWSRFRPPGTIDISIAPYSRETVTAVARLFTRWNPEVVITHSIGEGDIEHHSGADLVYRAWQEARRGGARLGQLWLRALTARLGAARTGGASLISEPSLRRFFEPTRISAGAGEDFFVVADAREPALETQPQWEKPLGAPFDYAPRRAKPVVMAVGAHSDDIEVQAGGTLTRLIQQGWRGIYVVSTNNTAGNYLDVPGAGAGSGQPRFPTDALETIHVRQEEGRSAAALLGAEPYFLDLHET